MLKIKSLLISVVTLALLQTGAQSSAQAAASSDAPSAPSAALITGFDDVLRQARNQGILPSLEKFFQIDRSFAGMSALYEELTANEEGNIKLHLVSGFPSLDKHRVSRFFKNGQYPHAQLTLRNWVTDRSLEKFKIQAVSKIIKAAPTRPFIVIFDNSSPSLTMATQLLKLFPSQLVGFYLHEMVHRNQTPVPGTQLYTTAFDIAKREWTAGRLQETQAVHVAQAILDEENPEMIIPSYGYCPLDYHPCADIAEDTQLAAICRPLEEKIHEICAERH